MDNKIFETIQESKNLIIGLAEFNREVKKNPNISLKAKSEKDIEELKGSINEYADFIVDKWDFEIDDGKTEHLLGDINDFLSLEEDTAKGKRGEQITNLRKRINEIIQ